MSLLFSWRSISINFYAVPPWTAMLWRCSNGACHASGRNWWIRRPSNFMWSRHLETPHFLPLKNGRGLGMSPVDAIVGCLCLWNRTCKPLKRYQIALKTIGLKWWLTMIDLHSFKEALFDRPGAAIRFQRPRVFIAFIDLYSLWPSPGMSLQYANNKFNSYSFMISWSSIAG